MATSNLLIYNSTVVTATITLSALVTSTTSTSNCRQGTVIDFGTPRPEMWLAKLQGAFTTTVTAGGTLDLYMAWSSSSTVFAGGCSGSDGFYGGPDGTPANGLQQLDFIGSLVVCAATASTVVQIQNAGVVVARARYGVPVVAMRTSTTLTSTSANHSLEFIPIYPQQQ